MQIIDSNWDNTLHIFASSFLPVLIKYTFNRVNEMEALVEIQLNLLGKIKRASRISSLKVQIK